MFERKVLDAAKRDAYARYPNEACGFVVDNSYVAIDNVHRDPENHFQMPSNSWLDYPNIQAVIHSHTHEQAFDPSVVMPGMGLDAPSEADMRSQLATGVPWGIILTDGQHARDPFWMGEHTLDEPLKERVFRHGVYDCYSLGRAYYWQMLGIKLPEYPRVDAWWDKGYDMLLDHFRECGFRLLGENESIQVHDACLAAVVSPEKRHEAVVNHCGVYTGNGKVLHHLYNRLSKEDPVMPYRRFIRHWMRYDP